MGFPGGSVIKNVPANSGVCLVAQLCLTLCDPMDCSPARLLCSWDSPGKNTGVGCHSLLQENLPNPGIEPSSPALQADSFPAEPPGKLSPKQEMQIQSVGQKIPWKAMATHSSFFAWKIPWTEEPGGLQSTRSQRVAHDWVVTEHTCTAF